MNMKTIMLIPILYFIALIFSPVVINAQEMYSVKIDIQTEFKRADGFTEERKERLEGDYSEQEIQDLIAVNKNQADWIRKKITIEKKQEKGRREINTYYFNREQMSSNQEEGQQFDDFFDDKNATKNKQENNVFGFTFPNINIDWDEILGEFSVEQENLDRFLSTFNQEKGRYLGIYGENMLGEKGVLVQDVVPDSPAEKAGIKKGDVIMSVNDQELNDVSALNKIIRELPEDSPAMIRLKRDGEDIILAAKPSNRPRSNENRLFNEWKFAQPGQDMEPITDSTPDKPKRLRLFSKSGENQKVRLGVVVEDMVNFNGLKIMEITPGSPADKAGLQVYDIIEKFDKIKVNDNKQLQSLVADKVGEEVTIQIRRQGKKLKKKVLLQP
jgi:membrane-associated protease RseP (regulator of RpoE activity)